jgi:hypothetical protein
MGTWQHIRFGGVGAGAGAAVGGGGTSMRVAGGERVEGIRCEG